jgi:hypothetical protein
MLSSTFSRKNGQTRATEQGCQLVYFRTKNSNLGKIWWTLTWNMLVYFITIWNILRPSGIHILWPYGKLPVLWFIFPHFGILYQEKSGNPAPEPFLLRPF